MADTKITALTELTSAASTDLLVIVDDPGGAAVTKKITLANALNLEYGGIYVTAGAGTQALEATTWTKITQFTADGDSSGGVTPAHGTDTITVADAGVYHVSFQCSYTGTNLAVYNIAVYWDGNRQNQVQIQRKIGTGTDVGSAGTAGHVTVASGSTAFELWLYAAGAADFNLVQGQLVVTKVG